VQVLDSRGDGLPNFQPHIFVCFGTFASYSVRRSLLIYISCRRIIISSALEDPSFNLKGIHITNIILNHCYLGVLIMCFILALGNRPQGSKWPYTFAIVGFVFITIYMTVSALVLAFKGHDQFVKDSKGSLDLGNFFSDTIFWNIVLSLAATLGLYVFASLIFVSRALPRYIFFSDLTTV
jgi:hypothetical protein